MADIVHVSFTTAPNDNTKIYGATGTYEKAGQSFKPTANIKCPQVDLDLGQNASPTDNLTVRIETTSGGNPTGTLVDPNATVTVAASTIPSSHAFVSFVFPATFNLTSGVQYAIVVQRDGSRDTTNFIGWLIRTDGTYADGIYLSQASGSWGAGPEGGDCLFKVYEREATTTSTTSTSTSTSTTSTSTSTTTTSTSTTSTSTTTTSTSTSTTVTTSTSTTVPYLKFSVVQNNKVLNLEVELLK